MLLLPLRSAVGSSATIPLRAPSDTESTSSLEKHPIEPGPYLTTDRPPTREQQRWQQRHNSLSTQRAIYPYAFEPHRSTSNFGSGGYSPFPRPASAARSYSQLGSQLNWNSTRTNSFVTASRPSTSRSSTVGSRPLTAHSSSTGSIHSRRYKLDHSADCPAIPESPRQLSLSKNSLEDLLAQRPKTAKDAPTPPPPAWCPALTHAPLSSDPAIRALTGSLSQLPQHQSPLQVLTDTSPTLSRQTTTSTSVLTLSSSRPSTAPSRTSTIGSHSLFPPAVPTSHLSPPRLVVPAFSSTPKVGLPASPRPVLTLSHPPMPPLPPLPQTELPLSIPRRATGHKAAATRSISTTSTSANAAALPIQAGGSRSGSSGRASSTVRQLRRPSPLRVRNKGTASAAKAQQKAQQQQVRSHSGARSTPSGQAGYGSEQQARSRSRGRSSHQYHQHQQQERASTQQGRMPPAIGAVERSGPRGAQQQQQQRTRSQHAKSPVASRYRTRGKSSASPPPMPLPLPLSAASQKAVPELGVVAGDGPAVLFSRRLRASTIAAAGAVATVTTAAAMAAVTAAAAVAARGNSAAAEGEGGNGENIHEERGRERIRREGWYAPDCYSVVGGGVADGGRV